MADEKKPSIYHDRGTIGSTKELDEYGVWVKSEPQILDSGGDETGSDDLSLDTPDELPEFSIEFDEDSGSEDPDFSILEEDFDLDDLVPAEIPAELSAAPAETEGDFSIPSGEDELPDFPETDLSAPNFSDDMAAAEENPEDQGGGEFTDMSLEDLLGEVADELPGEADAEKDLAEEPGKARDQTDILSSADRGASADMSTQLLLKIAAELSSIREELSALKQEFSMARGEPATDHAESRGFFDDSSGDDKIALTGDELDNIINTADFTEETGADATEEEPVQDFSEGDIPAAVGDVSLEAEEELSLDDTGVADLSLEDLPAEAVDFSLPAAGEEPDDTEMLLDNAGLVPDLETGPEIAEDISLEPSPDTFLLDDAVLSDTALDDTALGDAFPDDISLDDPSLDAISLDDIPLVDLSTEDAGLDDAVSDGFESGGAFPGDASLDDTAPGDAVSSDASLDEGSLGSLLDEISLDDLSFEDISQEERPLDEISLDDSGLEGISLGGEEIAIDDFEEDSLDLSDAVIDEPDLRLEIQENPGEEPADITVLEDEAVEFSLETVPEEPVEIPEELPAELLEEPAIPEIDAAELLEEPPILELDTIEDEQEIARAEERAAEIPASGSGASGGEDLEQIIPEGFLLDDLDEGETGFGGAGLDTLEEGVLLDEIPEDVLPEEEESPPRNDAVPEPELSGLLGGFKKELKQVLSYMDQLLESLPEEKIEEFAQSEYFDTYKKLFKELGLV
jgi:hypothetical protein